MADTGAVATRACDACKQRKVRCDKGSPCSNCKSSGATCRTTSRSEAAEPRSRVIITKEYEKKIDRMAHSLANIEAYLKRMPTTPSPINHQNIPSLAQTPANNFASPGSRSLSGSSGVFVDHAAATDAYDATPNTHSVHASKVIEQAVGENSSMNRNPALTSALASLKEMLGGINEHPNTADLSKTLWTRPIEKAPPPSRAEIYEILRRADNSLILTFFPVGTLGPLKQKVEDLFNHPKDAGPVRRVLVFGILFELCIEFSEERSDVAVAQRYSVLARMFLSKLEHAITELPLIIKPSVEAVTALIIAAAAAIDLCKPYLALSVTSSAAAMVISLGYNRLSSMQSDTEQQRQQKIYLFWMVYTFDTGFSIRLGRSPVIRDYDITVPMVTDTGMVPKAFVSILRYWVELGRVQCQALEHLLSPSALQQPLEERSKRAADLVVRLQEVWEARDIEDMSLAKAPLGSPSAFLFLLRESDAIMHYSTVALVQQATISTQNGTSPALDAARRALWLSIEIKKVHKDLPETMWSSHCHWTLLHAPFTPFTVVFCNIIANTLDASEDLRLLADFVATLKSLSSLSEGVAKLYRLCDVFQKVAELYVQAKAQEATRVNLQETNAAPPMQPSMQPAINDIDGYLSTIGFAPPPTENFANNSLGNDQLDATYLNDWFYGNSSLMGLLEQDLTYPGWSDVNFMPAQ